MESSVHASQSAGSLLEEFTTPEKRIPKNWLELTDLENRLANYWHPTQSPQVSETMSSSHNDGIDDSLSKDTNDLDTARGYSFVSPSTMILTLAIAGVLSASISLLLLCLCQLKRLWKSYTKSYYKSYWNLNRPAPRLSAMGQTAVRDHIANLQPQVSYLETYPQPIFDLSRRYIYHY